MKTLFGPLTVVFIIIMLGLSGYVANAFIAPLVGLSGWMAGILIAVVQMAFVAVVCLFSGLKITIPQILLGSVLIFVGAISGGFLSDFMALPRDFSVILVVCIQAILLQFTGIKSKRR